MKWKKKNKKKPMLGDKREVTRFAFFPTTVKHNGDDHWVWLERYTAVQEFIIRTAITASGPPYDYQAWTTTHGYIPS